MPDRVPAGSWFDKLTMSGDKFAMKGGAFARTLLAALVIAILIACVHGPALIRVFAADQIMFFAESAGTGTWSENIAWLDYNNARQYWRGDESLYRPVLSACLMLERWCFGANHVAWNLGSLVVHGLVSLLLWRFLRAIDPRGWPLLWALLFTVLQAHVELVTWNHLGGYLVAFALLVAGLTAAWRLVDNALLPQEAKASGKRNIHSAHPEPVEGWAATRSSSWFDRLTMSGADQAKTPSIASFAVAFSIGAMAHETVVVFSVLAAAWVWWACRGRRPSRRLILLLVPVALYGTLFAFHLRACTRFGYTVSREMGAGLSPVEWLLGIPRMAATYVVSILLPTAVHLGAAPFTRYEIAVPGWAPTAAFACNVALLVAAVVAWAPVLMGPTSRARRGLAGVAVVMLIAYMAIILLGRTVTNARENTYYVYLFALLMVVAVYAWLETSALKTWRRFAVPAVIVGLLILNAHLTRDVTERVAASNRAAHEYATALSIEVTSLPVGERVAVARENPPELDPWVTLVEGYEDDPGAPHRIERLSHILYSRRPAADTPTRTFRWTGNGFDTQR